MKKVILIFVVLIFVSSILFTASPGIGENFYKENTKILVIDQLCLTGEVTFSEIAAPSPN